MEVEASDAPMLDLYEPHQDKEEWTDDYYMKMKALESELEILSI